MAEDGDRDVGNGGEAPPDNVLQFPGDRDNVRYFPRDWFGPRSELVPFGPRADRGEAPALEAATPRTGRRVRQARRPARAKRAAGVRAGSSPAPDRPLSKPVLEPPAREPVLEPAGREPVLGPAARAPAQLEDAADLPLGADAFWSESAESLHEALRSPEAAAGVAVESSESAAGEPATAVPGRGFRVRAVAARKAAWCAAAVIFVAGVVGAAVGSIAGRQVGDVRLGRATTSDAHGNLSALALKLASPAGAKDPGTSGSTSGSTVKRTHGGARRGSAGGKLAGRARHRSASARDLARHPGHAVRRHGSRRRASTRKPRSSRTTTTHASGSSGAGATNTGATNAGVTSSGASTAGATTPGATAYSTYTATAPAPSTPLPQATGGSSSHSSVGTGSHSSVGPGSHSSVGTRSHSSVGTSSHSTDTAKSPSTNGSANTAQRQAGSGSQASRTSSRPQSPASAKAGHASALCTGLSQLGCQGSGS